MNIPLVKRGCNNAKQLAEKFLKDEIKYTTKEGNGAREYLSKDLKNVRITTSENGISIDRYVPSGHAEVELYSPLITRTRKPNNTTETVIPVKSSILNNLEKIITTIRKNGKKTTKTEYQHWDNGYKRITPMELYALITKGKIKNAAENTKEAIYQVLERIVG